MEEINLILAFLAAYLKTSPVYTFVLDSIPLVILSILGAMVEQLNSAQKVTTRNTMSGILTAVAVGITSSAIAKEYQLKIHLQVVIALLGGMKGKVLLSTIADKIIQKVRSK